MWMNHCFPAPGKLVSLTEQAIAITVAGTTCLPSLCLQLRWNKEQGNAKSEQHTISRTVEYMADSSGVMNTVFSLSQLFLMVTYFNNNDNNNNNNNKQLIPL